MTDRFFTVTKCDRCGASLEGCRIMSMFNNDCICMDCHRKERELPEFKQAAEAEKEMQSALGRIFAIAEAYPELKANENFVKLQQQLQDVEDKIQAARRFYNAGAKELNTKIKTFPANIVNNMFGHFKKRDYFEVAESEKAKIEKAPEVKF